MPCVFLVSEMHQKCIGNLWKRSSLNFNDIINLWSEHSFPNKDYDIDGFTRKTKKQKQNKMNKNITDDKY